MFGGLESTLGVYLATLVVALLSGVVPVISSEVYLGGVILAAGGDPARACVLAALVTLGEMVAKVGLFASMRGATNAARDTRLGRRVGDFRRTMARWRDKPLLVTFASAVVGLPPFYLVTLVAGVAGLRPRTFLWLGTLGRAIRFFAIALTVAYARP